MSDVVDGFILLATLAEIEEEIREKQSPKEKASLYHELGSIHGLMGDKRQQEVAWQKALELDPESVIFQLSLVRLKGLKVQI